MCALITRLYYMYMTYTYTQYVGEYGGQMSDLTLPMTVSQDACCSGPGPTALFHLRWRVGGIKVSRCVKAHLLLHHVQSVSSHQAGLHCQVV